MIFAIIALLFTSVVVKAVEEIENEPEAEFFQKYVNEPEPDFNWFYTGSNFRTMTGGHAYVLNITSLKWLDESVYTIEDGGTVWSHQAVVIVPKNLKHTNSSIIW